MAPPDATLPSVEALSPSEAAARAASRRAFFWHHSVGADVLAGVARLARRSSAPMSVLTLDQARAARGTAPALIHGSGGRNGDPASKLDSFVAVLPEVHGLGVELAFMKFCFVDFDPSTPVDALFASYTGALDRLARQYPSITFGHVTVPLVVRPRGLEPRLARLLGKRVWEDAANARRSAFNRRLLERYPPELVFDLARAESTAPDGSRESFVHDGATAFALVPAYASDGEHLNEPGQAAAARALVAFMARAPRARTAEPRDGGVSAARTDYESA